MGKRGISLYKDKSSGYHNHLRFRYQNSYVYGIHSLLYLRFWFWYITGYSIIPQWNPASGWQYRNCDSFRWIPSSPNNIISRYIEKRIT